MSSAQPGQPGRYQRSSSGLVAAMIILLLLIAAFVAFRAVFRGNQDDPVPTVGYVAAAKQARSDGGLLAPAPTTMPKGWRATSVRYEAGTHASWHLGILTDKDTYVGIEESRSRPTTVVVDALGGDATQGKARRLAGRTWQTWRDGKAYALTWTQGSDTVLVGGRAGEAKVVALTRVLGYGSTG